MTNTALCGQHVAEVIATKLGHEELLGKRIRIPECYSISSTRIAAAKASPAYPTVNAENPTKPEHFASLAQPERSAPNHKFVDPAISET